MKQLLILVLGLIPLFTAAKELHVAPQGSNRNPGTAKAPYATIQHAVDSAEAGDTIWVHTGRYLLTESIRIPRKPTSESRRCRLWAAGDGEVILDGSAMHHTTQSAFRGGRCIYVGPYVDYWHFRGLTLCHAEDNGMKVEGSYHIIEQCIFNDNNDTGLQLGMGMPMPGEVQIAGLPKGEPIANPNYQFCRGNRVINCDAYNNADLRTWNGKDNGGDADGFACKLYPGPGNEFYGCRAWNNSDDNWDLYMVYHPVVVEHCWAARAGYGADGQPLGNGNGFKLGGGGSSGGAMFPRSTGKHCVTHCIAFENRDKGFDQNYGSEGICLMHNIAWDNRYNYRFEAPLAAGYHTIHHCIGFRASERNHEFWPKNVAGEAVGLDENNNSWTTLDGCNPYREGEPNPTGERRWTTDYGNEFISLKFSDFTAPRNADGSLPDNGFGKPIATSALTGVIEQHRTTGTPLIRSYELTEPTERK